MAGNEILILREVAAILRCSKSHVSNLTHGRVPGVPRLPSISMGRRKLVRRTTLEEWMRAVEEGRAMLPAWPETAAGRMTKGAYHA
jgi:excisionase family DNA binding protein